MFKKAFLVFTAIGLITTSSFTQDDVSKYFDNGVKDTWKNKFKFDVASTIGGNFSLLYERLVLDNFAIEIGAGVMLPWRMEQMRALFNDDVDLVQSTDGGFSYQIALRWYLNRSSDEWPAHFGVFYKRQEYEQDGLDRGNTQVGWSGSYFTNIGSNLEFEFGVGLGVRFEKKIENIDFGNEDVVIATPILLRLNYKL